MVATILLKVTIPKRSVHLLASPLYHCLQVAESKLYGSYVATRNVPLVQLRDQRHHVTIHAAAGTEVNCAPIQACICIMKLTDKTCLLALKVSF